MKQYILLLVAVSFCTAGLAQNLALSATATASGNALQAASNAIDGNAGTRWESQFSDPQWISIDLGASYDIGQVVLNWEGAYASAYEIQVSDDPTFTSFTTAYSTTSGDGGIDEIDVSQTGRYVRMYGTVRGTIYGYSLWEFEVYEAVDPATIATLSDLTINGSTVAGFSSNVLIYTVELPMGTTDVPTVGAITSQAAASAELSDASSLPGTTTIIVTAQNGVDMRTYVINFTLEIVPVNQTFDLTFESGTVGSNADAWNVFENASNPPFEVVANPSVTGANTSATVGKLTTLIEGAPFAGCETQHGTIWEWVLNETTTTITIDVYKSVISDVGIKMVNTTSGTVFELLQANTLINEWETLSYDISSAVMSSENRAIDQIVVFTDWQEPRAADNVSYIDNISWEGLKLADGISTGISEHFDIAVEVFPNPTLDIWNINSSEEIISSVKIFDVEGELFLELSPNAHHLEIDATNLVAGLYYALIESQKGYRTIRLVKN